MLPLDAPYIHHRCAKIWEINTVRILRNTWKNMLSSKILSDRRHFLTICAAHLAQTRTRAVVSIKAAAFCSDETWRLGLKCYLYTNPRGGSSLYAECSQRGFVVTRLYDWGWNISCKQIHVAPKSVHERFVLIGQNLWILIFPVHCMLCMSVHCIVVVAPNEPPDLCIMAPCLPLLLGRGAIIYYRKVVLPCL